ncbi:MAG: hypothetical protein MAG431_01722 [Chloroflexi bacterium]|nr:hypothetical protein [Chloroflexota bacterium]
MPSIKKRLLLFSLILLLVARGCTPQNPSSSETSSEINGLKIYTTQEGIYHITAQELGWPELPSKLSLTLRGEPQPFWITKETHPPTLYFYAPEPDNPYTTYAIFILTPENGNQSRPTETYHPAETSARTTYTAHLRLEENISYQPLALENPWLGQRIIAPQTLTLPITLHKVASGPGSLQVRLWGKTQASAEPDHHIQLTLNGEPIANQTWDGQAPQIISAPIPENTLTTGENTLEITAPGDTEAPVDMIFLDWVEIAYPRQSQASNDTLRFEGGDTPLRLTGFGTTPVIYDVTAPEKAQRLVSADAVPDDPTFTGEAGHRYLAIGPGGYLSPDQISPLTRTPDLTSPTQGADYLAIGPAHLLTPLEPLLSHRQDQNLTTLAIPAAAIYDQFGDGFPDPVAIRNFLRYANQSWESVPQYVLLVGDATYDPKGHQFSTEGHLLPTLPIDTLHGGQTGSDVPLAQLDAPKTPGPT